MADWVDHTFKDIQFVFIGDDCEYHPFEGEVHLDGIDLRLPVEQWRGQIHLKGPWRPKKINTTICRYRVYCQGRCIKEGRIKSLHVDGTTLTFDIDYTIDLN